MPSYGSDLQNEAFSDAPDADVKAYAGWTFAEWESHAHAAVSPQVRDYIAGGAGLEDTMRENRDAFARYPIVPRMLRDVSEVDMTVELFGRVLSAPLLLAPIGVQRMVHPDGELGSAAAAARAGIPMVLSTVSSVSMEAVAEAGGGAPRWFQLYIGRDRDVASSMIRRAEASHYEAIVLTLDTQLLGWRTRDVRNRFDPLGLGLGVANYATDPAFRARYGLTERTDVLDVAGHVVRSISEPGLTWEDVRWLRRETRLPVLLKGILHPDDARLAAEAGVDGIIVSTHGGRQVDGSIGALDALPHVAAAVGGTMPVLFDSGIRCGADVMKALALGADAVLLGRPYLYGLTVDGATGVTWVVRNLMAELHLQMALSGCASVREIRSANVVRGL